MKTENKLLTEFIGRLFEFYCRAKMNESTKNVRSQKGQRCYELTIDDT